MKQNKQLRNVAVLLLGLLVTPSALMAQAYKLKLDKPKIEKLTSPDNAGNAGRKSYKPKDWMEVELKMKIEVPASKKETERFVDKVTVKWYLAAKNPEKGKRGYILLEKEVTYVNVPVGEDIYASIYLSPTAIKRLTGGDRIGKGDIENVGGEVRVNGVVAHKGSGLFTLKGSLKRDKWWNSGKISRYDKIPLRNKNETPFRNFWYDRYAEIETKR